MPNLKRLAGRDTLGLVFDREAREEPTSVEAPEDVIVDGGGEEPAPVDLAPSEMPGAVPAEPDAPSEDPDAGETPERKGFFGLGR